MTRWSNEPLDDREYPDESDADDSPEEDAVVPCPACGAPVYEDVQECPHCQALIPDSLHTWRAHTRWYYRAGNYLAKVLAMNWLAWIALSILTLLAALVAWMRK